MFHPGSAGEDLVNSILVRIIVWKLEHIEWNDELKLLTGTIFTDQPYRYNHGKLRFMTRIISL